MKLHQYVSALAFAIACASTALAQNPKPEFTTPCADSIYYLYNVRRGAFFTSGNDYWTRASLSESRANQIVLQRQNDANGRWDGHSYRIANWPARDFNHALYLFIESDGIIYTDQNVGNAPLDRCFSIVPSPAGGQMYRIGLSELNRELNPETMPGYFMGSFLTNDHSYLAWYKEDGDSVQIDWAFVTPAAYERYIQQLAETRYGTDTSCVPGTDFTSRLVNPDFEQKNYNDAGWVFTWGEVTNENRIFMSETVTGKNSFGQSRQLPFQFWQTAHNLPNGIYRVDVQAFIRPRGPHMSDVYRSDSTTIHAELFAGNQAVPIMNLMDAALVDMDGQADFMKEGGKFAPENYYVPSMAFQTMYGLYVPNNEKAVELAFMKGLFKQSLYVEVTDGQLTIGIRQQEARKGTWTAWDNFRLTYVGNDEAARELMSREQNAKAYLCKEPPVPTLIPKDALLFEPSQTPRATRAMHEQKMADVLNGLAYAAQERGDLDVALRIIDYAIIVQPATANYYDSKGEFLYLKGDKVGAQVQWYKVVELDPEFLEENGETNLYKLLHLEAYYGPRIEDMKDDYNALKDAIHQMMTNDSLLSSSVFYRACQYSYKLHPDFENCIGMALYAKNQLEDRGEALRYFKQAEELASTPMEKFATAQLIASAMMNEPRPSSTTMPEEWKALSTAEKNDLVQLWMVRQKVAAQKFEEAIDYGRKANVNTHFLAYCYLHMARAYRRSEDKSAIDMASQALDQIQLICPDFPSPYIDAERKNIENVRNIIEQRTATEEKFKGNKAALEAYKRRQEDIEAKRKAEEDFWKK